MCSPNEEGFPKGGGLVISLECLLRARCYLRTTLCHPVHLSDMPGDGTLLTEALYVSWFTARKN